MVFGWYHGLKMSPGLQQALLVLHWDACVIPLQYRVESHAGWPSLGFKAEAMVNYGTFNVYVFFLLCHFIISQILAWSQWLVVR